MARIKVPQSDGQIVITEGGDEPRIYRVKDGVITVDDSHVGAILGAVKGSELQPEAPASNAKQEAPAKEK